MPAARRIVDEAGLPTLLDGDRHEPERVFEITPEGRVGLMDPRISLFELRDQLPAGVGLLRHASESGRDVTLDEG